MEELKYDNAMEAQIVTRIGAMGAGTITEPGSLCIRIRPKIIRVAVEHGWLVVMPHSKTWFSMCKHTMTSSGEIDSEFLCRMMFSQPRRGATIISALVGKCLYE